MLYFLKSRESETENTFDRYRRAFRRRRNLSRESLFAAANARRFLLYLRASGVSRAIATAGSPCNLHSDYVQSMDENSAVLVDDSGAAVCARSLSHSRCFGERISRNRSHAACEIVRLPYDSSRAWPIGDGSLR